MFLLSAALLLAMQTEPRVKITAEMSGGKCVVKVDDKPVLASALRPMGERWKQEGFFVLFDAKQKSDYDCFEPVREVLKELRIYNIGYVARPGVSPLVHQVPEPEQ